MTQRSLNPSAIMERFRDHPCTAGDPPGPAVTFLPAHPAVGPVRIWDDGEEATIQIGELTHLHINPRDTSSSPVPTEQLGARITEGTIEFLEALFADRVRIWRGPLGCSGHNVANERFRTRGWLPGAYFVWSGPLG
jgi:hypothetical protein